MTSTHNPIFLRHSMLRLWVPQVLYPSHEWSVRLELTTDDVHETGGTETVCTSVHCFRVAHFIAPFPAMLLLITARYCLGTVCCVLLQAFLCRSWVPNSLLIVRAIVGRPSWWAAQRRYVAAPPVQIRSAPCCEDTKRSVRRAVPRNGCSMPPLRRV